MLVPIGEGRFQAPSPSLLAIAEEVVGRGISLRSALAVLEDIDRHCESVSRSFVELFLHEIWKPFAQADMPAERWPEIEHAVERLGPVASEALMAIFQRRLRGPDRGRVPGDHPAGSRSAPRRTGAGEWPRLSLQIPRRCGLSCSSAGSARRPAGAGARRTVREFGMPVSAWMIDHAGLQPGQRVLELAAGPGETGTSRRRADPARGDR